MTRPLLRHPVAPPLRDGCGAVGAVNGSAQVAITQDAMPGDTLTITVSDPDRNTDPETMQQVAATVVNATTGESEAVTLSETGANSGVFAGPIDTLKMAGAGSDDDGTINVLAGDVLEIAYDEPEPAGERTAQTVMQGTAAEITITQAPSPGDSLTITVTDPDADTDAGAPQQVAVAVTNGTTGESEAVTLSETGDATGVFSGMLATADAAGAGTDDDGTMNVQDGDELTASYTDAAPAGVRQATSSVFELPAVPVMTFLEDSGIGGNGSGSHSIDIGVDAKTLIVMLFASDGPTAPEFSNVQFDGVAMTKLVSAVADSGVGGGDNVRLDIYLLHNPAVGGAYDFTVSWSGAFISNRARFYSVDEIVDCLGVPSWNAEIETAHTSNTMSMSTVVSGSILLTGFAAEANAPGSFPSASGITFFTQTPTSSGINNLSVNTGHANEVGEAGLKEITWSFSASSDPIDVSVAAAVELSSV